MAADFNREKLLVKKMVHTYFQHQWQFRLEIEEQPLDFEIFIKDVTYGPIELEYEPVKVGVNQLQFPTGVMPVSISMTVRDHDDERIHKWFAEWTSKVANGDGTVNPPFNPETKWIRDWKKYTLLHKGTGFEEVLSETYPVAPVQLGDVTQSYSEHSFKEFPLTVIQFRS
ncbi:MULTISPECIES: hypothetical protein [Vibrio]|jgi:hypothetical protein|uniref:hypothetical protein n=2 Tax=Vibrio TaxID=662 RepID=UPI000CD351EC|nr:MULTISPECIES: hypothetical protein [Vibrio harveyi group]HAS6077952.1 hypothetical protein [Vibrio vulnificus]AUW07520.1 hypothetical protein C1N51_28265 [Vibrio campbellii]MBY7719714.1 hypothetical protein [Vibrio parahaemolyticus]MDF5600835.1 hypothetical protein [Vibrio parahaemolyticus]NEU19194.1 hypothetical protein [Vibrio parahaemolyticus]